MKLGLTLLLHCFIAINALAIEPTLFPDFNTEKMIVNVQVPGKSEAVILEPLLIKPNNPGPWKTVVLPSNCSGLEDRMWHFWTPELIKNGIAVILVDSFNPRGFARVCENGTLLGISNRINDINQVLDFLRRDGRFVKGKIAIAGHSFGATTSFLSAYEESQTKLGRTVNEGYNLFFAASAGCQGGFKNPKLIAPLLMVTGALDDRTPPKSCIEEVNRLKTNKQDAEIKLIDQASHTFSTSGVIFSNKVMKMPDDLPKMYIEKLAFTPGGTLVGLEDGETMTVSEGIKKYSGFLGSKIYGAHVGGNWDRADEVTELLINFLKKHGW